MSFNFGLFVIDVGSGGVCAAHFTAGFGARVAVAESCYLGNTCVNVSCMPRKLLVYGAHFSGDFEQARAYGWSVGKAQLDWATLIGNENRETQWPDGIYRNLLVNNGMTLFKSYTHPLDVHNVEVDGQRFSTRHILVVTDGWPQVSDIPDKEHAIISNEAFFFEHLLRRVLMVGGGYIVVEFASVFNGLGAKTTLFYRRDLFSRGFDHSVRRYLHDELGKKGLDLQFNDGIARIDKQVGGSPAATLKDGWVLEVDYVLYVTGRWPMLDDLGLENVGIGLADKDLIAADEYYQTSEPSILVLGDVIGRVQLTPVALAESMTVARRLFEPEEYRSMDYELIPTMVLSLPNIGTIGLIEEEALSVGYKVKIFESRFRPMKLTLTNDQEKALMKLVVDIHDDRVLGCHMIGAETGEILQGIAVAMRVGAAKRAFDETIGIRPTAVEEFVTLCMPTR